MLPPSDIDFLAERCLTYTVQADGGLTCVVIHDWQVPTGYQQSKTDLLLRLPPGYPDLAPDMWWCNPPLVLTNGGAPEATQVTEHYLGRPWQRWSRHLPPGVWRSGIDGLESYLARVRAEVARSAGGTA